MIVHKKTFFKKTIKNLELRGRTVLVRADYNVPQNTDGSIADDFRIRANLPTLKYLHRHGAKIVIISHLGRPEGPHDERFTLKSVAERLEELLGHKIMFVPECVGDLVKQTVKHAPPHAILLLENLRFHKEEEANDETFAQEIAKDTGARYFVQDGFGVVHRAHASTDAITHFVPSVSGLLLEREYTQITNAINDPEHPLVAVLGGAKVSDKVAIIERLVSLADSILVGGAMANTFLKYKGRDLGASKVESVDPILDAIYEKAAAKVGADHVDEFIILPTDVVVGHSPDDTATSVVSVAHINESEMALDIGPVTREHFTAKLAAARTILWNGPLGFSEHEQYAGGSDAAAAAILANKHAHSIVGGGDTADFALNYLANHQGDGSFTHISTGGGASLELMSGEKLPGIEALLDA